MSLRHLVAAAVVTACVIGTAQPVSAAPRDPVRQELRALVSEHGFPGALAAVRERDGDTRDLTAGPNVPVNGQVRIGSNTKTFVSVVVLQLVAEKKVELDAPVEKYLPGLVRGEGIDGRKITVRQLLQHTSGLPNYTEYLDTDGSFALQHTYWEPRDLLDLALAHPAVFAPGAKWEYSNTNYVVAGLLVQKVTGRPIAEQITDRVIRKAGLRHTYFPGVGDQSIRERHPHGYHPDESGELVDVTVLDPSWGWAAGQMIGTPEDLNSFFRALVGGRLLPPAQLKEMRTTVEAPEMWPGARYGLGIMSFPLSCGGVAWGHGGDIPGYETRGGVTEDGRGVSVAVTAMPSEEVAHNAVLKTVDTALCSH
ncbi:serine hydrolase domain-containing protein [Actinoplanes friuliensis]|uniref:D-alanyl-D-alanine carboxypeptidase n=1 Tax=Actinoplanes friuliensis DSM 7358 TaxID=1246995 RepID=U5VQR4_9ACTN|nr:serine hydrolase domain-containing protein [Actinoplanes friuliensis]AGZ39137.1 D-alanyl-D-alanine carboxypeptidase [Actinoplanes friuliensis DSM 7358]